METVKVRLDKWLWAARFFKTRTLAAEAVSGGKVHLNTNRVKPAHVVAVGDQLQIRKGPYEFVVIVKELSSQRGPARVASQLYEETPESRGTRERLAEQHRLSALAAPHSDKRPNKKQRRQISRFLGKNEPR
ncbi:MAG: S4 domain-containing protein [Gammaproteobacteria bacterium]|jgi:ribosome-associated heat shock protein Hsp15